MAGTYYEITYPMNSNLSIPDDHFLLWGEPNIYGDFFFKDKTKYIFSFMLTFSIHQNLFAVKFQITMC